MVQINDIAEENAAWGMLEGRSIPSWKFSVELPPGSGNYVPQNVGFGYTGTLAEMPQQRQATDYTTKEPKTYKDGRPIMEIILTLQTDERLDEDDDGMRRWYLTGMARRALQDEMKRLNIKRFGLGTRVTATVAGFKPNPKGRSTMLFNVQLIPTDYVAPQQAAVEHTLAQPYNTATQWAQPQQPPAQQYMQAAPGQYPPVQQTGPNPVTYQQAHPPVQQVQPQVQYQQPVAQAAPQVQYQQPVAQAAPQALYQGQPGYHQDPPAFSQPQPVAQVAPVAQPQFVAPVPQPVAQAPAQQAPVAQGTPLVTPDHLGQVQLLMVTGGINRQTAIQAVADGAAPGDAAFRDALDHQIAPEGMAVGAGETYIP